MRTNCYSALNDNVLSQIYKIDVKPGHTRRYHFIIENHSLVSLGWMVTSMCDVLTNMYTIVFCFIKTQL